MRGPRHRQLEKHLRVGTLDALSLVGQKKEGVGLQVNTIQTVEFGSSRETVQQANAVREAAFEQALQLSQNNAAVLSAYAEFDLRRKEMTLEEIGNHFGLTRERIRQIKERGLRRSLVPFTCCGSERPIEYLP